MKALSTNSLKFWKKIIYKYTFVSNINYLFSEAFIVCKNYSPPEGFDPKLLSHFLKFKYYDQNNLPVINKNLIPFLATGNFCGYDSDTTYGLQVLKCFI